MTPRPILIGFPLYSDESPSYALLSLAGAAAENGQDPLIVDLDYLFHPNRSLWGELSDGVHPPCFQLGALYHKLAAGREVPNSYRETIQVLADFLDEIPSTWLAASLVLSNWAIALPVLQELRRRKMERKIILGGHQVSLWVRLLKTGRFPTLAHHLSLSADALVFGEGERTLIEISSQMNSARNFSSEIPNGVVLLQNGALQFGGHREQIENIDTLPFPAWNRVLMRPNDGFNNKFPYSFLEISRGCVNRCTFCSDPGYFPGYRQKSADRIQAEIQAALPYNYFRQFALTGSVLPVGTRAGDEALSALAGNDIRWSSYIHLAGIDSSSAVNLAEAGCYQASVGIESADPEQRKRMNKYLGRLRPEHAVECLLEKGIQVDASFVFCFPGETNASVDATIGLIQRLRSKIGIKVFEFLPAVFSAFSTTQIEDTSFQEGDDGLGTVFGPGVLYSPPLFVTKKVHNHARRQLEELGLADEFCVVRKAGV